MYGVTFLLSADIRSRGGPAAFTGLSDASTEFWKRWPVRRVPGPSSARPMRKPVL